MKKSELIENLSERTQLNKATCESVINAFAIEIEMALRDNESLSLHGIGKWMIRERKARIVRNPQTGQSMEVPAKKAVVFKVSSRINEVVNKHSVEGNQTAKMASVG